MSGSWTKERDRFFPCKTWSVNYEWYWETAIWSGIYTLYFRFRAEKMFCMKILLLLPKFHEKTLSRSEDIKIFCPGSRMYIYTLPTIYGRSVKWRKTINEMGGNIPVGNFLRGNIKGEHFPGKVWWVRVGVLPGGIFLEPSLQWIFLYWKMEILLLWFMKEL